MNPRVCIFAAESLLHWSGFYVRAFRQCCDTIAIGPAIVPAEHDYPDWERVAPYVIANDIHTRSPQTLDRLALLPDGWDPDLLVVIQSGDVPLQGLGLAGCPTVHISVDTWHDMGEFARPFEYDFVFVAQKALVKYMALRGCCRAYWLPLGCDPEYHAAAGGAEIMHDIVFVGRVSYLVNVQRRKRLEALERHFNLGVYGGVGAHEMAEALGRARLIFNASIACDVNMRVFEALATGRPLVTNREARANGLFDLFEDGVHLITYDDGDLVAQVRKYLADPEGARAIGEAGRTEVLARHTYVHRVRQLFDILRAHNIEPGKRPCPRVCEARRFLDFIPRGALRVLDIGLGLQSSRVALTHRGVEHLAGIAPDGLRARQRANSYDDVWTLDSAPEPSGDFDTAVCAARGGLGRPLDGLLHYAAGWLVKGGRVLLALEEADYREAVGEGGFSELTEHFLERDWQVLRWCPPVAGMPHHTLVLARLGATADEISVAMYGEFPVNGVNTTPWKGITADEVPDLPDAVGP